MERKLRKIVCETFVSIIWHKKGTWPAWLSGWQPFDILQSSLGSLDQRGNEREEEGGGNCIANYTHNTHHYIMLQSAPLAFDVSKLPATFANVMPKKLHLQLKVIPAQATAGAEPSSWRNEKNQAGLYETIGRGPFTGKQWPKTFLASAKMCMQCASLSSTSTLSLSLSLSLFVIRWQSCVIKK